MIFLRFIDVVDTTVCPILLHVFWPISFPTQNDHLKAIRVVAIISSDFFLLDLDQIMISIEILKN